MASHLKAEFSKHIAEQAAPEDDPMYVKLHGQYIGHILYDFETRANAKLFRVIAIFREYHRSKMINVLLYPW
jgi:hypothetical protein